MGTPVEGTSASGQADSGRPPVKTGGKVNITAPTFADGNAADTQMDVRGNQRVALISHGGASTPLITVMSGSGQSVPTTMAMWAIQALLNGATMDFARTAAVFKHFASTAITAGTGATIWTPAAGKKFRLMGWVISSSVAGQLIFGDNLAATVIARGEAVAAAGVSNVEGLGNGILSAAANNVLKLDGPTGNVAGMVWGTEE